MGISNMSKAVVSDLVPNKFPGYEAFGFHDDLKQIFKSNVFMPIFITGETGNGKTLLPTQVCAELGQELVSVSITQETDEDDLLGGFRLKDGATVWHDGPVIVAMEKGAKLLLDEIDLGTTKLLCLQQVLENKPIYLKKIDRVVKSKPGFNVVATANTKGRGSDVGRYIGTNIMNEAFLERFPITFEQGYPSPEVEKKILENVLNQKKVSKTSQGNFVDVLVQWADLIRRANSDNSIEDLMTTRRLVRICEVYAVFGRKDKALDLCLARFESQTKKTFIDLYSKIDDKFRRSTGPKPAFSQPQTKSAYDPF